MLKSTRGIVESKLRQFFDECMTKKSCLRKSRFISTLLVYNLTDPIGMRDSAMDLTAYRVTLEFIQSV